jgi:gamma-glutamylcyclotransferase (GGCT)/AIG2-like uncharacterized protein YtfP
MENRRLYLAYGSNLSLEQMALRCPDALPVGTAEISGYHLLFKGSGTGSYLTIEPKRRAKVPVAVWQVSEADEKRLDRYEGYPKFYYKKELDLNAASLLDPDLKMKIHAFVYIMHEERRLGEPHLRYFWTCIKGYRAFGFDPEFLYEAYERSAKGVR